jgi:hypothetical protein
MEYNKIKKSRNHMIGRNDAMITVGGNNYLSLDEIASQFSASVEQIREILNNHGVTYVAIGNSFYVLETLFTNIFLGKTNLIQENTIISKSYSLPITERTILAETIKLLDEKNVISLSDLREELKSRLNLSSEDLLINNNRNDTRFDQKVRNLICHREFNGLETLCEYKRIGKESFLLKKGINDNDFINKDF